MVLSLYERRKEDLRSSQDYFLENNSEVFTSIQLIEDAKRFAGRRPFNIDRPELSALKRKPFSNDKPETNAINLDALSGLCLTSMIARRSKIT
jgi:hypothetical protein